MLSKIISYKNKFFILFLFLFSITINQHYGNRGAFPIDSFFHFDVAYRILNGAHPFSDFWTVSGPAVDYIQAIFFYIFGVNWYSYVLHASLMNALLTISTFFVLISFKLKINYCFLYSLFFSILAYPSSGTPFVDHHSTFFSLLGIYSLLLAINNEKKLYWISTPIFLGLAFFSKQVPATYIILFVCLILLLYTLNNKKFDGVKYFLIGSVLFIFCVLIFGKTQGIKLASFFDQYIFYPQTIGLERFDNFNFTFRGFFGHFKFIYVAIAPIFYIGFKKIFTNNKYLQNKEFYLFLSLFFLTFSLILHQLLTKNQTFIFFLIPVLAAFSHISLIGNNLKFKNLFKLILILICLFATIKYHLRFNENRKFHEFKNANFELSIDATEIHKKLSGLNWITPQFEINPKEEINLINQIQSHLKGDSRNKMVMTNYSFFSVILDQNFFSPFRASAGDGTTHPAKDNKYSKKYKELIINLIEKNNILVIYIIDPLDSNSIYNYIDQNCFEEFSVFENLKGYELKDCDEINS